MKPSSSSVSSSDSSSSSLSTHHEALISNTIISFPNKPYDCQISFMEKVLLALDLGKNALLESPTGTGKTLSLLCATLSWQNKIKELIQKKQPLPPGFKIIPKASSNGNSGNGGGISKLASRIGMSSEMASAINSLGNSPDTNLPPPPTIIYATRTHSQLSQVVAELKRTNYNPKMTLLGSRDLLCINSNVNKLRGTVLNHTCTVLSSKKSCFYKNNLDYLTNTSINNNSSNNIFDIEDLNEYGKANSVCSYFYSRDIIESSELIFLPYNYLLDTNIRKTLKIEWNNSVIIFDEAHNIEKVASDASSFSISSTDIAICTEELQEVLKNLKEEYEINKLSNKDNDNSEANNSNNNSSSDSSVQKPSLKMVAHLLSSMFQLEAALDSLQLTIPKNNNNSLTSPCFINSGQWLAALYANSGFNQIFHAEELRKCSNYLMELNEQNSSQLNSTMGGSGGGTVYATEPKLVLFTTTFERILKSISSFADDFKVYIADEYENIKSNQNTRTNYSQNNKKVTKRVINFWCFTTGVALTELKSLGVRSILLTSGTLSPIEALKDDLRLPFEIELMNPHVISPSQIWLGALSKGSTGKTLNSSYSNRENDEYKDELGETILSIYKGLVSNDKTKINNIDNNINTINSVSETSIFSFSSSSSNKNKIKYESKSNNSSNNTIKNNSNNYNSNYNNDLPIINSTNGGVLVFFPTYSVMESTVERWKQTGIFDSLRSTIGSIIVEPRGSVGVKSNNSSSRVYMSETKSLAYDNSSSLFSLGTTQKNKFKTPNPSSNNNDNEDQIFNSIISDFESSIKKWGSCLLLGVCRGKVSEGIDFSNEKGRVVIITGIPYAPNHDPWVVLKKQYLDERIIKINSNNSLNSTPTASQVVPANFTSDKNLWLKAKGNSSVYPPSPSSTSSTSQLLSGNLWYNQSASRAVNQALGRVIRHKKDWGAIFLLDERFHQERQVDQLSKWLRPRLKKFNDFSSSLNDFTSFLNIISRDKNLLLLPEPTQSNSHQSKKLNNIKEIVNQKDQVKKVVVINESQINDGQKVETSYINKNLLLSQSESKSLDTKNSMSSIEDSSNVSSKPNLKSIIERMRGEISAKSNSKSASSDINEKPSSSISTNSTSIKESENIVGRDPLHNFQPADSTTYLSQNSLSTSSKFQLSQHISFLTQDSIEDKKNEKIKWKIDENNKMEDLKPFIKSLKPLITSDVFNSLKELIQTTKKNGGIINLIQINNFLISFFNLFKYDEKNKYSLQIENIIQNFVGKLVLLVQNDEIKPIYLEKSKQLYNNYKLRGFFNKESSSNNKSESSLPLNTLVNNKEIERKRIFSAINSISDEGRSIGSERAKKILSLTQSSSLSSSSSTSLSSSSKSLNNPLSLLDNSIATLSSKHLNRTTSNSLLECIACREPAKNPCAAKCGHICCESCWRKWFQVNLTCPQCRSPASIATISKILIKK